MKNIETYIEITAQDPETSEDLTRRLKNILSDEDGIRELKIPTGQAPKGSFAGDVLTAGAMALAVLPAMVPVVFSAIKDLKQKFSAPIIKIKVKSGDKEMELEFPRNISQEEIQAIADGILQKLG